MEDVGDKLTIHVSPQKEQGSLGSAAAMNLSAMSWYVSGVKRIRKEPFT